MKPIFLLCLFLAAGDAAAQACPEEFPVDGIKLSSLPKGWKGIVPTRLLLTSADVIVGAPQPGVAIGEERKTKRGYEVTYDATSSRPTEKWLACRYGGGVLAMAERLPDDTESCVVSYDKRQAFNSYDIKVACRTKAAKPGAR
jgi:hypothetical protein